MNAPTLWIVVPILLGTLLLFINNERALSIIGGTLAVTLALVAQFVPIELAMKVGSFSLKIDSSLTVLGRVLAIKPSEGPLLALIYGAAALWFFGAEASKTATRIVPLGFMIIALMVASIAVQPFLYAALFIEMAILLAIPLLTSIYAPPSRGVVRFLIYQTLAMPFILLAGWMLAGVAGAALAPTDPAVMFSVLGNHEIGGRSGTTLEGEAGLNDPAGIALMIGMIELATHADASAAVVVREFAVEMSVGAALGIVGGLLLAAILRRIRLPSASLHPLLALILAAALYGVTSRLHGSGFLAVFLAGLIVGDSTPRHKTTITSFSSPLAILAEIAVFVALGLTVALSSLSWRTWFEGVVLMLALAVVARPVTVIATLVGARFSTAERAFMAWSGLKGAVPILLAAFAVLESVEGAKRIYNVVFVVVLLSVICQGTLVGMVARRLGIPIRDRPSTA